MAFLAAAGAGLLASGVAVASEQPATPSGTITFQTHSADLGVGYTWGEGKLVYQGHTYRFKVRGPNVIALGYSSLKAKGKVYNLKHLHDFDGAYGSLDGEATMAEGVGGALLKNSNGVRLKVTANASGARLAAGLQGLNFTLKN
ncbi:DUF1134 domain-containing protein [Saccharibacter sp. 17.LH.SD]|nr:DUF1134 domain-containing protein [Saccharibacter sp. 17.LH.SD]